MQTRLKEEGNTYFIVNVSKKATLKNGFRYIKELILQHHNFKMFNDAKSLRENGINIYSIKTDALTIQRSDLEKAQQLLSFSKDIGGWRFSKDETLSFQKTNYNWFTIMK